MQRRRRTGLAFALSAVTAVVMGAAPAQAVNDLALVVAPGSESVNPGGTVTLTLEISNLVEAINGVQVLIGYDASILSLADLTPTTLSLTPPAAGWMEVAFSDAAGAVTWTGIITEGATAANHTIATLTFDVIDEGVTSVVFQADALPFATKLTTFDNETVFPTKVNSGAITSQCDDGEFCNGVETFDGLVCQPGSFPCDDMVDCTDDSCDEVTDTCSSIPSDVNCDDGLFCNGNETCDAVLDCLAGTFPCDDMVDCTDDACDENTDTCSSLPNDANCDDGLFCNGSESCDAVLDCMGGTAPCDDGVDCTVDICDEVGDVCVFTPDDLFCDDGVFCNGAETCDAVLDCQPSVDPCAPLICDEGSDSCLSPIHVANVELFYAGRLGNAPNPSRAFLAPGSTATQDNITNYMRGITGIRVTFDTLVTFATTARDAFSFEWTTGTGTLFSSVTDAASMISATASDVGGVTVVDIVIVNDHVRRRWLKVTIDAAQVTSGGVALDGELTGNPLVLPSGDGTPGGNSVFVIGNLSGDVDNDRKTTLTDIGLIRGQVNPFVTVPITNIFDVDKDGKVQLADVGAARVDVNPFVTLPLITP